MKKCFHNKIEYSNYKIEYSNYKIIMIFTDCNNTSYVYKNLDICMSKKNKIYVSTDDYLTVFENCRLFLFYNNDRILRKLNIRLINSELFLNGEQYIFKDTIFKIDQLHYRITIADTDLNFKFKSFITNIMNDRQYSGTIYCQYIDNYLYIKNRYINI